MAPRLPTPGGDKGNWGAILNEYLAVAHKPDGTLQDDSIPEVSLDAGVRAKLNSGGGTPGATGAQGPQGPAGTSGSQGATGPQGLAGATGTPGTQGNTGATGPAGTSGQVGATGSVGATGAQGPAGQDGADSTVPGPQGATGPQGPQGIQGEPGPAATIGATGAQGATGPAGNDGTSGTDGATGAQGPAGATGPQGTQGLQGATGASGSSGQPGATGAQGTQGNTGATGPQGPAGSGGSIDTEVYFSTLAGANDDAKLAAFMTAQSGGSFKGRTLVLDEVRDYTFTTQQTLYNGFSIRGPFRPQDQARGSMPVANRIRLRMTGGAKGWFRQPNGNIFGVSITNMSIDGDANSYLVEGNASGVLWTSVFRDISVQNALGVLGSPSQSLLVTACTIDGWWNVNNVQSRAFALGGSDFYLSPSMMLLDSPPELLPPTGYLMNLSSLSNAWISNIYCTAEGHTAALLTGGSNDDSAWIKQCVFEGRNAPSPSPGALIRMTGGQYMLRDNRFAYAMTDPAATGRSDAGVIHVAGGKLLVDGATYARATGVAESVPFIYVTGASTRVVVRNVVALGSWTGKPIVQQSQAGLVDADDSVTVVTA